MLEERREEIMGAVFSALCDCGYADLTMQDIADESSLSKGSLHYHYDTKRALLLAFLEHLYDRFTGRLDEQVEAAGEDPGERLVALVDAALLPPRKADVREFRTAVLEIKAQAPYVPAYRERLAEFDAFVHDRVASIVADGIEAGRFDEDADPDAVASFVVTVVNGAHTRSVAIDHPVDEARETLVAYLQRRLTGGEEVVTG